MANGIKFIPFGGGVWPDTNMPNTDQGDSPYYKDGWHNRPVHYENPTDMFIDDIVYPDRAEGSDSQYLKSRNIGVSIGNITGRKPGPSD
jgi:hypothetical protein